MDRQIEKKRIMLWYYRLGHLLFSYLECLFSKLFSNIFGSRLICEQYIFAKIHCISFKISSNKICISVTYVYIECVAFFILILLLVINIFFFIDDYIRVT